MLTKIRIVIIIITLLLSSMWVLNDGSQVAEAGTYTTPNTGVTWNIKQLAVNSSGTVSGSASLWYVKDMLTVSAQDTLIIPPGTTIRVDKDVRIDIKGKLISEGTANNTIKFTSNLITPKAGDWLALRFNEAKSDSVLKYTTVEYVYDGIYIFKSGLKIENSVVRHILYRGIYCREDTATIHNNTVYDVHNPDKDSLYEGTGIKTYDSKAVISNNTVYDIQKSGIKIDYSDNHVLGNNVSRCLYGINVYRANPYVNGNLFWNNSQGMVLWENTLFSIEKNTVANNTEIGIFIQETEIDINDNIIIGNGLGIKNYYTNKNVTIRNNDILLNEKGISIEKLLKSTIKNNYIWYNSREPLFLDRVSEMVVEGNVFDRNEDHGISLVDCSDVVISRNSVNDSRGGNSLLLENSKDIDVLDNKFYDSGFHGIKLESSNVTRCWNNDIQYSHSKDVWLDDSYLYAINLTFDRGLVVANSKSYFLHKNYLTVRVQDKFKTSIQGVNISVTDNGKKVYFDKTDSSGKVYDMLLADITYDGSSIISDNATIVTAEHPDHTFDNNPRLVNMSTPHLEIFGKNQNPTIDIKIPGNNEDVSGQIFINGTTFDADIYIESVDVRIDNGTWQKAKSLGQYWSKWTVIWNTTFSSDGLHTITARVYDGITYDYDSITVNVKNGGSGGNGHGPLFYIIIHTPINDQVVIGEIQIIGTAYSSESSIIGVDIKIDDRPWELAIPQTRYDEIFNEKTGQYETITIVDWGIWRYNWNTSNETNGLHTIQAKMRDGKNNVDLEQIEVIVDNTGSSTGLKIFEISSPSSGKVLKGVVEITGRLSGVDATDPKILLRIDTDGEWFEPEMFKYFNWWLFNYDWDTTNVSDGMHEIQAKADTNSGTLKDQRVVIIRNGGAESGFEIRITSPEDGEMLTGTFDVEGYVWNYGTGIQGIELRVDDNSWHDIRNYEVQQISEDEGGSGPGSSNNLYWIYWTYPLDTIPYIDGVHYIKVKTYDSTSTVYSTVTAIFVNENLSIDNGVIDKNLTNKLVDIKITQPVNGDIVSNTVKIKGVAWARYKNITSIELQIGNLPYLRPVKKAEDWTFWEYSWDSTIPPDGPIEIKAKVNAVYKETIISKVQSIWVIVNNGKGDIGPIVEDQLTVIILYPAEEDVLKGTVEIYGIGWASRNRTIQNIQVKIDDDIWLDAESINPNFLTWSYFLNTSWYKNGPHSLTARLNSEGDLREASVGITINNSGPYIPPDDNNQSGNGNKTEDDNGDIMPVLDQTLINLLLTAIIIIIILMVIIFFFIFKLRGKTEARADRDLDSDPRIDLEEKRAEEGGMKEPEEDHFEIDTSMYDEEGDDEVIVIKAEVMPRKPPLGKTVQRSDLQRVVGLIPTAKLTPDEKSGLPKTRPLEEEKKRDKKENQKIGGALEEESKSIENGLKGGKTDKHPGSEEISPEIAQKLKLLDKKLSEGKINAVLYEKLRKKYVEGTSKKSLKGQEGLNGEAMSRDPPMNCKSCGKPPTYIEKYNAWYCKSCKSYVAREATK